MGNRVDDAVQAIEPVEISGLEKELATIGVDDTRLFVESLVEAVENARMMYLSRNIGGVEPDYIEDGELCPYCVTDLQEALGDSLKRRFTGPFSQHPYLIIKYLGEWGVLLGYEGSKERVQLSSRWAQKLGEYLKTGNKL